MKLCGRVSGGMAAATVVALVAAAPAWAAVAVTSPTSGQRTNVSTPTVAGTADGVGDVTVNLDPGAGTPDTAKAFTASRSGGSWSGPSPALADGTWTVQGVQGTTSSSPVTFVVDTAPPAVSVTGPPDGAVTRDATPIVSGGAGDATGDAATVTVEVLSGATVVRTISVARTGAGWSTGISPALPDGTYTVRAKQADDAGNSATSTSRTLTVDTAAPNVAITSPADGFSSTETAPTFSGTASDAGDVVVEIFRDGHVVQRLFPHNGAGAWSVRVAPLPPGTYVVQASQSDAAGNTGFSPPRSFAVTSPPAPTTTTSATKPTTTVLPPAPPKAVRSLLSPFPVVRIIGRLVRNGARLSLVTVRSPAGATVDFRCKGRSCPFKKKVIRVSAKRGKTVTINGLAGHTLRSGVVIEVRVMRDGHFGKYTRFRIRKGKSPLRLDTCVRDDDPDPVRCP